MLRYTCIACLAQSWLMSQYMWRTLTQCLMRQSCLKLGWQWCQAYYQNCLCNVTKHGRWNGCTNILHKGNSFGYVNDVTDLALILIFASVMYLRSRSQWPRGLRRRSTAARLLRLWVWIPPGAWMFVCCECCVLSGRGLCVGLLTRPEESYRLWRVVACDHETSKEEAKAR